MVRVKCLKCGSTGYSASTRATCECGGGCRGINPEDGQGDQQLTKIEYEVTDLVANLLKKLLA